MIYIRGGDADQVIKSCKTKTNKFLLSDNDKYAYELSDLNGWSATQLCDILAKGTYQVVFKINNLKSEGNLVKDKMYILKIQTEPYNIDKYNQDMELLGDLDYLPKIYNFGSLKFDNQDQTSYNYIITDICETNFRSLTLLGKLTIAKQLVGLVDHLIKNDYTLLDLKIDNIGYMLENNNLDTLKLILLDYDQKTLCYYKDYNKVYIYTFPWTLCTYASFDIKTAQDIADKTKFLNSARSGVCEVILDLLFNYSKVKFMEMTYWNMLNKKVQLVNGVDTLVYDELNQDIIELLKTIKSKYTEINEELGKEIVRTLLVGENLNFGNVLNDLKKIATVSMEQSNSSYYVKYLKYKIKYMKLKNLINQNR
jgi:hypothetical protein